MVGDGLNVLAVDQDLPGLDKVKDVLFVIERTRSCAIPALVVLLPLLFREALNREAMIVGSSKAGWGGN